MKEKSEESLMKSGEQRKTGRFWREEQMFGLGSIDCVSPLGYLSGDIEQLFFCNCKVVVSKSGGFRIEIIISATKPAEIVKNKSRERRGEEWSREEKTGKVRSLDKLWFKSKKKKVKEKRNWRR